MEMLLQCISHTGHFASFNIIKESPKKGTRWLIIGKNNFAGAVLHVKNILASCG